jgi:hypothetical protein
VPSSALRDEARGWGPASLRWAPGADGYALPPATTYLSIDTRTRTVNGTVLAVLAAVGDTRAYWLPAPGTTATAGLATPSLFIEGETSGGIMITWLAPDYHPAPAIATFELVGPGLLIVVTDGAWRRREVPRTPRTHDPIGSDPYGGLVMSEKRRKSSLEFRDLPGPARGPALDRRHLCHRHGSGRRPHVHRARRRAELGGYRPGVQRTRGEDRPMMRWGATARHPRRSVMDLLTVPPGPRAVITSSRGNESPTTIREW